MRKTLIFLLMVVPIFAAACSSSNNGTSTAANQGTTPTSEAASPSSSASSGGQSSTGASLPGKVNDHGTKTLSGNTIKMEQDDFYFGPTFVKAPGGQTVEVQLENEGTTAHTFTIDSQNIDVTLQPGDEQTVEVKLPTSGQVVFYCKFHRGQGMQGAFLVQ